MLTIVGLLKKTNTVEPLIYLTTMHRAMVETQNRPGTQRNDKNHFEERKNPKS